MGFGIPSAFDDAVGDVRAPISARLNRYLQKSLAPHWVDTNRQSRAQWSIYLNPIRRPDQRFPLHVLQN
ncbi:Uncharacterised protein [Vibrio cholerae]|nr:Uncharacterised protein [Vibrio cholerae]